MTSILIDCGSFTKTYVQRHRTLREVARLAIVITQITSAPRWTFTVAPNPSRLETVPTNLF